MATFAESKVATNSSDANFRAWGKSISDGLQSVGIIKTADAGQIDWATVAAPALSTVGGYEIRRFDDALQSTSPYFLKIEYGTGSTTSNPQIWLTLGHITDGAGTLTLGSGQGSVVRHVVFPAAGVTASASSFPIEISGTSSRFSAAIWRNKGTSAASGCLFGLGRSKDNAGANTASYATLLITHGSAGSKQYTLPQNGTSLSSPGTENLWLGAVTTLSSSSFNNKKQLGEIKPFLGSSGNPMTIFAGLKTADWLTDAETFAATLYGASVTYRVILNNSINGAITNNGGATMAMRWD
jgi:hypothetical protein